MNILTIDTVLDKTYISLSINDKKIFKTIESDEKNYHSAYLIKVLDEIFKCENFSLNDVEYIGTNTGVGSFTGIRVGLSISKIISNRLNLKSITYNTIEVLSRAYNNKNIMLDARRGSVFYSNDGKNIELIPYEKANEILENGEKFICDNSLLKRFENFSDKLISYEKENKNLSEVELLIAEEKIKNNEITDYNGIKPTYIQTPPVFSK